MAEMDEETYKSIFSKKGLTKSERDALLNDIKAQRALYLFSKQNKLRIHLFRLSQSQKFENFIIGLIILSSLNLALGTYTEDSPIKFYQDKLDIAISSLFALESAVKAIAVGFVMD